MKKRFSLCIVASLTALVMFLASCTSSASGNAKVGAMEHEIARELNFARTRPAEYADTILTPKLSRFNGNMYRMDNGVNLITNEGAAAVREAIGELKTQRPLPPLSLDTALSKASALLADHQAHTNEIGHVGPGDMQMGERISRYGKWGVTIGENCGYGSNTAREIVAQLIIDDGVPSRGHRKNIYNGAFRVVGVAYRTGGAYGSVCVMDFAGSFSAN